jgi:hypothetical protein
MSVLFGRFLWMMLGPCLLVMLAVSILTAGSGWLTGLDVLYFIVLAFTLLGRWWEFRGGNPLTSTGEPATMDHLRRYCVVMSSVAVGLWILANLVGNHWLPG